MGLGDRKLNWMTDLILSISRLWESEIPDRIIINLAYMLTSLNESNGFIFVSLSFWNPAFSRWQYCQTLSISTVFSGAQRNKMVRQNLEFPPRALIYLRRHQTVLLLKLSLQWVCTYMHGKHYREIFKVTPWPCGHFTHLIQKCLWAQFLNDLKSRGL